MHKAIHVGSFAILMLGWLALAPAAAQAADYYVAPGGGDNLAPAAPTNLTVQ